MYAIRSLREVVSSYAARNGLSVVLHIPHASVSLPERAFPNCLIPPDELRAVARVMADRRVDELFADWDCPKVVAPYSRLYVDVERYWEDEKEPAAAYGMGAVYEKDLYGRKIREITPEYRATAKRDYDAHHALLRQTCLSAPTDVLLLDVHSYDDDLAGVFARGPFPDVCIGTNADRDAVLCSLLSSLCDEAGLSHRENFPYSGAMTVPDVGKRVVSVMTEFHKRTYL